MDLTHVRLLVDDLAACLAFYRDVIGLNVSLEVPDTYIEMRAGSAILALYRRDLMSQVTGDESTRSRGDTVVLSFNVADVDATFDAFRSRGATVVTEPHDQEAWAIRVAHLRDPEGNLIEVNHPLPH